MRKKDRHELIKKIISENAIRNQNELMDYLQQYQVSATQATKQLMNPASHVLNCSKISKNRLRMMILSDLYV